MNKLIVIFILSVISAFSSAESLTEERLTQLAHDFVSAKNARQQPKTSLEDIEHFLSLISDEFVDEHIKYNVTETSKKNLRKNMIAKMRDKIIFSSIKIDDLMIGSNVVFIKMTETGKVKPAHLEKTIEYTSTNIVSLEFNKAGLIKHIRRHHGS